MTVQAGTKPPRSPRSPSRPLPRRFFARDTVTVARELVGCTLWTERDGELCAGRIVETEAYLGEGDAASHAARGMTARNRVMFGMPAVAYVYLIYGMHHCLNLVTERPGEAGAVLLRALEPQVGLQAMRRRRGGAQRGVRSLSADREGYGGRDDLLCAGPGRLCAALGVDLTWNGLALCQNALALSATDRAPSSGELAAQLVTTCRVWVASGQVPDVVAAGPRIGVGQAVDRPYRFVDPMSPCLSRRSPG